MDSISIVKKYFTFFITLVLTIVFVIFTFIFVDILVLDHKSKINVLIESNLQNKKDKLKSSVENTIIFLEEEYKRLNLKSKKDPDLKPLFSGLSNYNFFNGCEIIIFNDEQNMLFSTYLSNISPNFLFDLTDNNNKNFLKELHEKVKNKDKGVFITYSWDRPYKTTLKNNKLTFGKYSDRLGLTITSHLFIDDIERQITLEEDFLSILTFKTNIAMATFFLSILAIVFLFVFYMVKKLQRTYKESVDYFLEEIKKDAHVIEDDKRFYGFGKIISYCNELYSQLQKHKKKIHKLQAELKDKSTSDYLTGFANRKYFYSTCKDIISIAIREKTPLSFILIGVEDFEKMSDEYGYETTDKIIHDIANIIKLSIRDCDIATRLSNGEMILLLYNTPYSGSSVLLDRIKNKFTNRKIILKDKEVIYNTYFHNLEFDFDQDQNVDDLINRMKLDLNKKELDQE